MGVVLEFIPPAHRGVVWGGSHINNTLPSKETPPFRQGGTDGQAWEICSGPLRL